MYSLFANCEYIRSLHTRLADTGGLTAAGETAVREEIHASYLKRHHPQGVSSW